jgi:hypothetical protein
LGSSRADHLGVRVKKPPGSQTAADLKISPETVLRDWKFAKSWLRREMSGAAKPPADT